eukprot:CAMPEP_0183337268 /NCGR_PEP_ID=MMETSP0164_2-20130417/4978_1 /TAXON_ID=221442 /ORGANISM="Coccolithus pelagicus ssp braarudi, Strain PLY182g" /LENGTH=77 /DNA_ID=CAMNT_0025506935 /DNA_START=382 /DNA_END=615 /DNA_ORIENTATION=+
MEARVYAARVHGEQIGAAYDGHVAPPWLQHLVEGTAYFLEEGELQAHLNEDTRRAWTNSVEQSKHTACTHELLCTPE